MLYLPLFLSRFIVALKRENDFVGLARYHRPEDKMDLRDPIYDRLLEPKAMNAAWTALVSRYSWFKHRSVLNNFESIKKLGLEPRDPGHVGYERSRLELSQLGPLCRSIICLSPFEVELPLHGSRFCVAVHRDHLPSTVAMDYSFPDTWKDAAQLKSTSPQLDDAAIFTRVVSGAGSFACYDPIAPEYLRVWVASAPIDRPEEWPELLKIDCPDKWSYC